jgi:hypothetical protein
MMAADVSQLNLREPDLINFDKYQDGGNSFTPPPEGKYFGQVSPITDEAFGATGEGYLKLTVPEITIVNAQTGNGYKVKYTQLSSKKYAKREGSQFLDFLRAAGIAARPTSNEELKSAAKMASGRVVQFQLIWEAYDKNTKQSTSGYENFPVDPADASKRLTYVLDTIDENKKWYANGKVRYFISAINK